MAAFDPLRTLDFGAKLATMTTKKPPEQEVGARVRVKAEHADAAADRFSRDGLLPIFVEHRTDGAVSFWFGNLNDADL